MRGTRRVVKIVEFRAGIIPAYAGNTQTRQTRHPKQWDHPRVCGEHWFRGLPGSIAGGSSPRMRGTPFFVLPLCRVYGIIPACAGNTRRILCGYRGNGDHPRVCGEHPVRNTTTEPVLGSSPRMRGTPDITVFIGFSEGIIPAYAGNTRARIRFARRNWDHPRVCGEHRRLSHSKSQTVGSSPRMRGTRGILSRGSPTRGIIPAYAGNTSRLRLIR